jgi:HAD superfamily hydrolase (TIGR01509 family)
LRDNWRELVLNLDLPPEGDGIVTPIEAVIFDIDGVLVDSPHERAWRAALADFTDPARLTAELYQAHIAGKPRLDGARSALEQLGVPNAASRAESYAATKQQLLAAMIEARDFTVFPDAVAFLLAIRARGLRVAAASSSKNANRMMELIQLPTGGTLRDAFDANLCGREVHRGKPDPEIFLAAATELQVAPVRCLVVEDAGVGIAAGRAAGMRTLGVARRGDADLLRAAAAELVVTSLARVAVDGLREGRLDAALEHPPEYAFEPTDDPNWVVRHQGAEPLRECDLEARLAIGNGFLGTRGARDIGRGPTWMSATPSLTVVSWPRSYVAGLFDTPDLEPSVPVLMPVPDWTRLRLRLDGVALHGLDATRCLDMKRSALIGDWSAGPDLHIQTLRIVSMADRALALQVLRLTALRDCTLTLDAWFDTAHVSLEPIEALEDLGVWCGESSPTRLAMAAVASLAVDGAAIQPSERGALQWSWDWKARQGEVACFERLVAVARGDAAAGNEARAALARARGGWRGTLAAHEAAWRERWQYSDIVIEGDDDAQHALRFAIHHLSTSANPADPSVSIGARGLTGDGYLGHVFWDTDIYMLPFFTLTWPEAARALLLYRHRTLAGAKAKAAANGFAGAMYAWESAEDTGAEATPDHVIGSDGKPVEVLCARQEQHITADIAYAVWNHWQVTGDSGFLREAGAEIMLETARFWASRVECDADGRCHIRHVIGPDEYHENVDDNAFTNMMARWNLQRGCEVAALLRERWPEDWARLAVDDATLAEWRRIAETLVTGYDPRTGLFEQFEGFFARGPVDPRYGMHDIKQADVVALLALLPESASALDTERNLRFYAPRCSHESSLSRPLHALVAARLGKPELAFEYFRAAAAIDLTGPPGTDAAGLHMATLGGLWQVAVLGFGGLSWREETLHLDPHLPPCWTSFGFSVQWRGRTVTLRIDAANATVQAKLASGAALPLVVQGSEHRLEEGQTLVVPLAPR